MTALKIQKAAFQRFATQGFAATSMNEIATDVGIKKPSIYAHFTNKDALYLSLIPIMVEEELDYAKANLIGGDQAKQQIVDYLSSIEQRFNDSYAVRFWVTALLNPPTHIYDQVIHPMHDFMDELESIFKNLVQQSSLINNKNQLDATTLARIFMSFTDSLQSELVYGGKEKFHRRLNALIKAIDILTL